MSRTYAYDGIYENSFPPMYRSGDPGNPTRNRAVYKDDPRQSFYGHDTALHDRVSNSIQPGSEVHGHSEDHPRWTLFERDSYMYKQPPATVSRYSEELHGQNRHGSMKGDIIQPITAKNSKEHTNEEDSIKTNAKPKLCQGIGEILTDYADHCSLNGAPYISISTWWLSRLIWCVLLATAMGFMGYHLYILIQKFLSYPTQNSIQLGFSTLQFPAVTICNVNAVRKSQTWRFSDKFKELVDKTEPTDLQLAIELYINKTDDEELSFDEIDFGYDNLDYSPRENVNDTYLDELDGYGDSWESQSKDSQFYAKDSEFTDTYATEELAARIAGGHQLDDMLVSCSYAGKQCNTSFFKTIQSAKYGNCFSLQYSKFVSRASGPDNGLQMMFYLESDEYLQGLTADKGLHVVIHPQQSVPFPEDDGIAVPSGGNTFIALKMVRAEKLGKPYGDCTSNDDFMQQYGVGYTRKTCQEFCKQQMIHKLCGCRDEIQEEINRLLKVRNMTACRSVKVSINRELLSERVKRLNVSEMVCLKNVTWNFYNQDDTACSCNMACSDTQYIKTVSARPWPSTGMIKVLKGLMCARNATACTALNSLDDFLFDDEFVKLNIYFEDLNYENITEQASYEVVQFVSDVGGTLGLWIGLSILSVFEIFQLFIELLRFLSCCVWRNQK